MRRTTRLRSFWFMLFVVFVLGRVNTSFSQSGPLEPNLVGAFYLSYPLDPAVFNSTSKRINSVFDHTMVNEDPYDLDGVVMAFTGQEGRLSFDTATPDIGIYTHAPNGSEFLLGGAYFGGSWGSHWLSYDGHPGVDLRTRDLQSVDGEIGHVNVFAAAGGIVECVFVPAANETTDVTSCPGGGGSVVIDHRNGYRTIYMHLFRSAVAKGDQVQRGQVIGIAGQRGAANQPHLHFEVRRAGIRVDPYGWSGGCVDPYRQAVNTNLWTNSGTQWNFDQNGNLAGWMPNSIPGQDGITHIECFSVHHDATINSGALWIDPAANDPNIQSPPLVNVSASAFRTVEMRVISGSPSTKGRVYFTTDTSADWNEAKSVAFDVRNDGAWNVIRVSMGTNAAWTGAITAIRIDPAESGLPSDSSDTIAFDYIKLTNGQPSATITANGQDGSVRVARDEPLRIEIAADGGTSGFANPSELYFGLNVSGATYWLTPLGNFTTTVTRLYRGPLPSFGPAALLNLPSAGALPDGDYRWFVLVVNGSTPIYDIVTTTIGPDTASPPSITGLNPPSPPVVNGNQSIGVLGSGFQAGLMVDVYNGSGVKIGTLSGTQIQNVTNGSFTMIANLGAAAGTFGIEVVNPDGQRSNRQVFNTVPPTPAPVVTGLNPSSPPVVNGNQSIGVLGSGFQPGLTVDVYNGSGVKIGTLSGTQIQNVSAGSFTMIANLGATPGTFSMEVENPDGKRSNRHTFNTLQPAPVVSGLSPSSPPVVNGNQSIGVFGSNFLPGLIVDVYNSSGVRIGTLSGTQIQNVTSSSFTMIANLGATPGTFGIEVVNPDGKRSNRRTFSTVNPTPVISGLNPSSPPVVNGNQSIGVFGSSFLPGLIVDVYNSSGVRIGTLSGTQIQNVTSSSFTMIANLGGAPATFGMEVVNTDGKRSARWIFSTR